MSLFASQHVQGRPTHYLEIVEPVAGVTPNFVESSNYYFFKDTLVPKFVCTPLSPPRSKILELVRPEDPEHDALEAIVRSTPRRGLTRPLDEDTRRFLQRALQAPYSISTPPKEETKESLTTTKDPSAEVSLAEELMEAEEGKAVRKDQCYDFRENEEECEMREAIERDRLGKLALSVEEDEGEDGGLSAAARRLDALLAESRNLHEELAGIQEDLQVLVQRVSRRDP